MAHYKNKKDIAIKSFKNWCLSILQKSLLKWTCDRVIATFRLSFNDRLSLVIAKTGAVLPYYYMADAGGKRATALPSTRLVVVL